MKSAVRNVERAIEGSTC